MSEVNNQFYDDLGTRWYEAKDDPVALLRSESQLKLAWIQDRLKDLEKNRRLQILDIGCGAGFVTNPLALQGHQVTGLDLAEGALEVARQYDESSQVNYICADAMQLPMESKSLDVVICLDFLEHVEDPKGIIQEVSRVLKPGGQFFYHTFSKNWLAYLVVIKGVEWFVKNTPKDMHIYRLFIDHEDVKGWMGENHLEPVESTGLRPKVNRAFLNLLSSREVPEAFEFTLTQSELISYLGYGVKITAQ